jgi:hypothetical protein
VLLLEAPLPSGRDEAVYVKKKEARYSKGHAGFLFAYVS